MTEALVLCCYVTLDPRTKKALEASGEKVVFCDTSATDYSYPSAIESHWTGEHDLIIVEQDMDVSTECIRSLVECDQQWCVYAYQGPYPEPLTESLGCTKFGVSARRKAQWDLVSAAFAGNPTWAGIDTFISTAVKEHCKIAPHVHGVIGHYHDYSVVRPLTPTNPDVLLENDDDFAYMYSLNKDGTKGPLIHKMSHLRLDLGRKSPLTG